MESWKENYNYWADLIKTHTHGPRSTLWRVIIKRTPRSLALSQTTIYFHWLFVVGVYLVPTSKALLPKSLSSMYRKRGKPNDAQPLWRQRHQWRQKFGKKRRPLWLLLLLRLSKRALFFRVETLEIVHRYGCVGPQTGTVVYLGIPIHEKECI